MVVTAEGVAGSAALRPPLKWAGGKRWLVPHLRPLWEAHRERRLVEPLCGGLAVALGLLPERALLNDVNPHNVNFYRWLKTGLTIDLKMKNEEDAYYRCRKRFNRLVERGQVDSQEAAELFYYLNRSGYNGLCRFNRKGEFNVPFGRHTTINYVRDFSRYVPALANWDFTTGDFEAVELQPDDFVYADPPYDVEFRQYSKEGFGWENQERLASWLARHPGPVVLSNQATERVLNLYRDLGFDLRLEQAPRMISCNGDRTKAIEVIATRNLPATNPPAAHRTSAVLPFGSRSGQSQAQDGRPRGGESKNGSALLVDLLPNSPSPATERGPGGEV